MLWVNESAKPRSKDALEVKPSTGLNTVLAVRRVLDYQGVTCSKFKLTRTVLKGRMEAHMAVHGRRSLLPKRKEPIPDGVHAMCFALPPGTRLGKTPADQSSLTSSHSWT